MSGLKNSKFYKFISSLFNQDAGDNASYLEVAKDEITSDEPNNRVRLWKKDYNPLRQLLLWGYDENNNPSFVILYGKHEFKDKRSDGNVLQDEVKYTSYLVINGKEGHLPSFKAVKIIEPYDYNTRSNTASKMYFKKGVSYTWSYRANDEYQVLGFKNLPQEMQVSFPYFVSLSQNKYVQELAKHNINFEGFRLANNPEEVLKLNKDFSQYSRLIIDILSNQNIYMRKKMLSELINNNPSKEVFTLLLSIGSAEMISGLFLELAKENNPILIEEAKVMLDSDIKWAEANYAEGVKRCIRIYINALDKSLKDERENNIRKYLSKMDLHLIKINDKDIPQDKVLEGSAYRKYAATGLLQDYYWSYDYKTRKSSRVEASKRYEEGIYSDGVRLKIVDFKNTIQEAEAYGFSDVIGRIAYYIDAPRITYYLKGSGKVKALNYFRRYIIRVIDSYAEKNPDKFMEAMKHMLTSYTKQDYVCKYKGNFQFNSLLKYYLYQDYKENPPVGWEYWEERHEWMVNDQLLQLEGRYEFMKEIWDNHLEVVADIALGAQIEHVSRACYYILKDSPKSNEFIENISYKQLINLALSPYKSLSDMFMNILTDKLGRLNIFDPELMICLIGSSDKRMHEAAAEFFKRTNGLFSPSDTADLLFLGNIDVWNDLFKQNLLSFEGEKYIEFINEILKRADNFLELKIELSESITDILTISTGRVSQLSRDNRFRLIEQLFAELSKGSKLPQWVGTYIEEVIFSVSYEDLKALASKLVIEQAEGWTPSRNKRITDVIEAIKNKNIPSDAQIINILERGTSKMIKVLFDIIIENSEELEGRFSTLLIMLESDAAVLNEKAKEIFDAISKEEQKKLHAMIIDSPVPKAYSYGLQKLDMLYKDTIPGEFILQMMEHSSPEVKAYISDKTHRILNDLGNGNEKLFMYYVKTLLLLPNRVSKSKEMVYKVIPEFALEHGDNKEEIESMLLGLGGSNSIIDSERALVALAKIRGEVV